MILELVKTFQAEERSQQKKELEALKKKIESKLAENSSLSQGKGR